MRIAFTQETKPKMKKRRPIMRVEMTVSFFVSERISTEAACILLMNRTLFLICRNYIFRQKRRGGLVQKHTTMLVQLKNAGGITITHTPRQTVSYRQCFSAIGHGTNNVFRFYDLFYRHGDRLPWHISKCVKPSLAQLLLAASLVQ